MRWRRPKAKTIASPKSVGCRSERYVLRNLSTTMVPGCLGAEVLSQWVGVWSAILRKAFGTRTLTSSSYQPYTPAHLRRHTTLSSFRLSELTGRLRQISSRLSLEGTAIGQLNSSYRPVLCDPERISLWRTQAECWGKTLVGRTFPIRAWAVHEWIHLRAQPSNPQAFIPRHKYARMKSCHNSDASHLKFLMTNARSTPQAYITT